MLHRKRLHRQTGRRVGYCPCVVDDIKSVLDDIAQRNRPVIDICGRVFGKYPLGQLFMKSRRQRAVNPVRPIAVRIRAAMVSHILGMRQRFDRLLYKFVCSVGAEMLHRKRLHRQTGRRVGNCPCVVDDVETVFHNVAQCDCIVCDICGRVLGVDVLGQSGIDRGQIARQTVQSVADGFCVGGKVGGGQRRVGF